jgi:hypothetical protein
MQRDIEMHPVDQPVRRTVILKADGAGLFGAHGLGGSFDDVKRG